MIDNSMIFRFLHGGPSQIEMFDPKMSAAEKTRSATGEKGRTHTINKNGGRDHWGNLAPLLLAGGGIKSGQVIGRSDS